MIQRFDAFVSGITVCYKYIQRIKSAEMGELGLKGTQVMCLYYLRQYPEGLTSAQLCALCAEDKAAVSRTVSELRRQGFLTSSAEKNYRAPLRLTQAGQEVCQQMEPLIEEWVAAGGIGLTDEARADFYESLALIASNLKKKMDSEHRF